ncbi:MULTISPECIES: hypothetical protein [Endozoicomonas]|uniref:Uncharacterized protein n=2 Tax=Endozoicomonas TaxID=305899 RepID=A0ABV2SK64_9GAMM|nr:hypothetical protein [Endozoicomonas euniceicola]UYM17339.1 hypothetical protein NX720_05285 [Endozoicomonas euniceicola]
MNNYNCDQTVPCTETENNTLANCKKNNWRQRWERMDETSQESKWRREGKLK